MIFLRKSEEYGIAEEGLELHVGAEQGGKVSSQFGRSNVECLSGLEMQVLALEFHHHRIPAFCLAESYEAEAAGIAPYLYQTVVGRHPGTALDIAHGLHRNADNGGIIQRKVVYQPNPKSQQERDDEYLCISPSDMHFPEYVSEHLRHFLKETVRNSIVYCCWASV